MILSDYKQIKSGSEELKKFANVMFVAFGFFGLIGFFKGSQNWIYFAVISFVFIVLRFTAYQLLKPFYKIWMLAAVILGFIMTRIILAVFFFLILTPIALAARVFGSRFLDVTWKKSASSYWKIKSHNSDRIRHYERQF